MKRKKYGILPYLFILIFLLMIPATVKAGNQDFSLSPITAPFFDPIDFINSSFEEPNIMALDGKTSGYYNQDLVPGWETRPVDPADESNAHAKSIEIQTEAMEGVKPVDGIQFIELSADVPGILYQTVKTEPGQKVYYEFYHRGRRGIDLMEFYLLNTDNETVENSTPIKKVSTDKTNWERYYGTYTVPDGQTSTTFAFFSAGTSSTTSPQKEGNLLDCIRLFYPSFLEVSKNVSTNSAGDENGQLYAYIGDRVSYEIEITNIGEADTSRTVLTDVLPDGVAIEMDSIEILYRDADNNQEQIPVTDQVSYDNETDQLKIGVGKLISDVNTHADGTYSIESGGSVTITFDVRVTGIGVVLGSEIKNQALVTYNDLGFENFNLDPSGTEILDEYNVSEIVSFRLETRRDIRIVKEISDLAEEPIHFVFRISYESSRPGHIPNSYYAVVTIQSGEDTGYSEIKQLLPGDYIITEIDSSLAYNIRHPDEQVENRTLDGLSDQQEEIYFYNVSTGIHWIYDTGGIENKMKEVS